MTSFLTPLFQRYAGLMLGAVLGLSALGAHGHAYVAGELKIVHPFASATRPGASTGAFYIKRIENLSKQDDRLLSVSTPAAAQVQIHSMETSTAGVMKMRELKSLLVKGASATDLGAKSGFHLMLVGLSQPLKSGEKIPATLTFERAGAVSVEFVVEATASEPAPQQHNHATH